MNPENHYNSLPYLIIVLLSLSPCCISRIHDKDLLDNIYIEDQEYSNAFGAYPSNYYYNSGRKEEQGYLPFFERLRKLAASSDKSVNVLNYGAKGDGKTDDSKAFQKAWKEACSISSSKVKFVVPTTKTNSYHLKPIRFKGPCKSDITVQIAGTIIASDDRSNYKKDARHWLVFDKVINLSVGGGGIIDGNGNIWWENSCKINKTKPSKGAPTALTFYKCKNLVVKDLRIQNAQQMHVSFQRCTHVEASNLVVHAPEESPNTDGIHITATQNIQITNTTIATGDDCISIVNESENIQATNITCGPGHGISIGSLGSRNSKAHVSDVMLNGAKLSGTTNGVRIKTWQGGSGTASNITFQNVEMQDVKNPIIIDQNYCDQDGPCKQQSSAVQVKNIFYRNITGTSASKVAIDFDCSKTHPCRGIVLQNVNLAGNEDVGVQNVTAVCNNVNVIKHKGTVSPRCPK
ncbi:polygalacturonase-like [Henckelia pumila]|uniref:polygalacturonase-like n=1 Tax=Henckelia pumila TaxID=405737 RepID=UPI003C6E86C8